MLTIKQRRQKVIELIGYGKPQSDIFFCGKNEGDGWYINDDAQTDLSLNNLKTPYSENIDIKKYHSGTAYYGYRFIMENLENHQSALNNNNYFVTNIWPFGKKKNGYGPIEKEIEYFGFNFLDKITDSVLDKRFEAMKLFFDLYKWESKYLYFCIGKDERFLCWAKIFISDYLGIKTTWTKHSDNTSYLETHNIFLIPHGCLMNRRGKNVIIDLNEISRIKNKHR